MGWIDRGFDRVLGACGSGAAPAALLLCSFLAGLLIALAFRWLADGAKIRRARDEMLAHMLAIRLFRDQIAAALWSYPLAGRAAVRYVGLGLPALAAVLLPLLCLYSQLEGRLDFAAPAAGRQLLLTARLRPGADLNQARLEVPAAVRVTAPPVHLPQSGEVTWRTQPAECGSFDARLVVGGFQAGKRIQVCDSFRRLQPESASASWPMALFTAGDGQLPAGGAVQSITLDYPERRLALAGHELDWRLLFVLLAIFFAFLLKPITGAEF